jgi:radical SAM superfamily enzyme YgiQ (UPF0313 family)
MKSFLRVLLVAIPVESVTRPPAAMPILAACCETAGAQYDFIDLNLQMHAALSVQDAESLRTDLIFNSMSKRSREIFDGICGAIHKAIDQFHPDLVAISVFTYQSIQAAVIVLDHLRRRSDRGDFSVVLGGIGVGSECPDLLGQQRFDRWARSTGQAEFVITGEAELSFVQLLKGNMQAPGINDNPPDQILDLNQIPTPSFQKINVHEYFYSDSPEISVTGSKGCVRDCSFCDVNNIWKKYVYRDGIRVAEDLFNIWQQTGVHKFDFSDSLINGSIKNFRQMNRRLIELRLQHPEFNPIYHGQFICRPIGQMKYQDYQDMKDAGVGTVIVGIEHFSHNIRKNIGKDFDNAAIDWHFETCARLGIHNVLLLLSGYITETIQDHQINLQYLKRYQIFALSRTIYSINIEPTGLHISKGTPLSHTLMEEYPDVPIVNNRYWVYPNNPDLTPRERVRRTAEVIYTAADLGYNVLHFSNKVNTIKKHLTMLPDDSSGSVFGILTADRLTNNPVVL